MKIMRDKTFEEELDAAEMRGMLKMVHMIANYMENPNIENIKAYVPASFEKNVNIGRLKDYKLLAHRNRIYIKDVLSERPGIKAKD